MPNGNYWDPEEERSVRQAFSEIGSAIEEFAEKHSLHIQRYERNDPIWEMLFRRHIGGVSKIDIWLDTDTMDRFLIDGIWWYDSYENKRRYIRQTERAVFRRGDPPPLLKEILTSVLETIDSWQPDNWDRVTPPNRNWREKTREEFIKWHEKNYPVR